MAKGKYLEDVKGSIMEQIEEYERGKIELSDEEIEETMPKVIAFYNSQPEGEDIYRDKNGCILLIQTPKAIFEKDKTGKVKKDEKGNPIIVNKLEKYPSNYGGEDQYLLKNCKFRISNRVDSIGLFATKDVWRQMGSVYDEKAFVKCSSLKTTYKKIGDDNKAMREGKFLEMLNKAFDDEEDFYQSISDVDESDYLTFYGATITQVIK